jgi:dephospho-CoA kinase
MRLKKHLEQLFWRCCSKRDKLAEIVFSDSEKLQLNAIVHPAVKRHFKQWLLGKKAFPIVVYEAAILFESGNYKDFDSIITVTAPLESRIQELLSEIKQREIKY